MANDKNNDNRFTNEDTLVRRAWIDSALDGARACIEEPLPPAEAGGFVVESAAFAAEPEESEGPNLYLAWSADERRSGT